MTTTTVQRAQTALATILLALALLTGCSSPDTSTAAAETPGEPAAEGALPKELARSVYRQQQPGFAAGMSDSDIDSLAEATCDAFDAGASPEAMVIASMDAGLESETGSTMMLAAMVYCPEHLPMVQRFGGTY